MKRALQVCSIGLLLLGMLLAGVVVPSPVSQAQSQPPSVKVVQAPLVETPGRSGGELTDASTTVPRSLNPYVDFNDLVTLMQAHLVEVNPLTLAIEPALAESYTASEDKTKLTFTLREGLRWSDGEPLTVDDIVFTFVDVLQNQELLNSLQQFGVNIDPPPFQLVALDARMFRFEFSVPIADQALPDLTRIAVILPKHKLAASVKKLTPSAAPDAFAQAWSLNISPDQVAGLGPFRLKEIQKTGIPFISERVTSVVLERNPFYWKVDPAGTQLPYIDRFTRMFVPSAADLLAKVQSGEIDILGVRPPDAAGLAGQPGVQLNVDGPVPTITLFSFNQDVEDPELRALFRDVRFRQAAAYTVNRDALLQGTPGQAPFFAPRESFVHPLSPFFNPAATMTYAFDLEKAKTLLDAIGLRDGNGDGVREYSNGKPVAFEFITNVNNPVRVAAGGLMQESFRQVGIQVDFKAIPFDTVVQRIGTPEQKPDYEAVMIGFLVDGSSIASSGYLQCFFGSTGECHIQRFSDSHGAELSETQSRIDEILMDPGQTPGEQNERLTELQRIISEDVSLIPMWSERTVTLAKPNVKNAQKINFFGLAPFVEVLWKE